MFVRTAFYTLTCKRYVFSVQGERFICSQDKVLNGPIYTRDGSSVWDELGQRTVVRLIIRLCINTGFQTDHPSRRTITVVRLDRRTTVDNSSGRMIRLSVEIRAEDELLKNQDRQGDDLPCTHAFSSRLDELSA